jgi:hypothetical protein
VGAARFEDDPMHDRFLTSQAENDTALRADTGVVRNPTAERQYAVPGSAGDPVTPGTVVDSYPLSPMQQGMLYHWLRDPHGGVDLEQITGTLDTIDIPTFVRAWEQVTRRHASLRTGFRWQDTDVPLQDVVAAVSLDVHEEDLRAHPPQEQLRLRDAYLDADRRRGFDFATPPLFRLAFFRTG